MSGRQKGEQKSFKPHEGCESEGLNDKTERNERPKTWQVEGRGECEMKMLVGSMKWFGMNKPMDLYWLFILNVDIGWCHDDAG